MKKNISSTSVLKGVFLLIVSVLFYTQTAYAAVSYSQSIALQPGWNIVSTPRILDSHIFSAPETLSNFAIYTLDASSPSGWSSVSGELTPLYGYFINNKTGVNQTLTLNYKASTTPNERFFERKFTTTGWYSIGVANPTYADRQNEVNVDENNPSQVLDSVLASTDLVVDFTDASASFSPSSVTITDPWKSVTKSDVNSLADIRDTKGYAVYVNNVQTHYIGLQNESDDGATTSAPSYTPGTLSIIKATDSPSGNVVLQGSGVTLAKYTFHAVGEKMKVENLTLGFTTSTSSGATLRNGALFANGVQIGSTQTILQMGTLFNLGSALQVDAGADVTIEVRADIYNNGTGGQFMANDTIQIQLLAGISNVYRMTSSLDYISSSSSSANQIMVGDASITLAKYSAYANQTAVVPQTAYKIGDFRLTTGATGGVNLDTISLTLSGTVTVADLSSLYVMYNSKNTAAKATGAASQSWSISEAVAASTTINVAVYATLSGSAAGSTTATLTITGTSQQSGNAIASADVAGQTITVGTGSITSAVDASTPVAALVVANSMPKVAAFKFTTSNEAYTVTELTAKVASAADAAAIKNIVFKDGATTIATQPMNGIYATSTGLTVAVPLNGTKVVDVYADLDGVGMGFASTSVNVGVTLDGFEKMTSGGVKSRDYTDRAGNAMYAYKTKPTITNAALPTSVLTAGTQTIAKFTITADAGGTISWRKLVFTIATSTPSGSFSVTNPTLVDESGTAIAGITMVPSTGLAGTITASSTAGTADQEVSGSKTYTLKATIGGSPVTGSSVSTSIATGVGTFVASTNATAVAGTAASFVWSDQSSSPHSDLTQDWNNDYLVKNLSTDSQTLTK